MKTLSDEREQSQFDASNGRLPDVVLSYAVGNLVITPFWYLFFARNTMGLDEEFVAHYYELPQEFSGPDCIAAVILGAFFSLGIYVVLRICRNQSPSLYEAARATVTIPTFAFLAVLICYLILRNSYIASNAFAVLATDNLC